MSRRVITQASIEAAYWLEKIDELKANLGLKTDTELCVDLGLSRTMMSMVRTGRAELPSVTRFALLSKLGHTKTDADVIRSLEQVLPKEFAAILAQTNNETQREKRGFEQAKVQTSSGRYIDLLDLKPADIFIEDIAHSLSNIARFNGRTRPLYTVAQHCVLCSRINSANNALEKLMHDASEAYVGDMVTPVKNLFPGYRAMEDGIAGVIEKAFGLPKNFHLHPEVRRADLIMVALEKKALFKINEEDKTEWSGIYAELWESFGVAPEQLEEEAPDCCPIIPWTPEQAEQAFLDTFSKLTTNHSGEKS